MHVHIESSLKVVASTHVAKSDEIGGSQLVFENYASYLNFVFLCLGFSHNYNLIQQ